MKPNRHQLAAIREAWRYSLAPTVVAQVLHLPILTIITEYVRLDDIAPS